MNDDAQSRARAEAEWPNDSPRPRSSPRVASRTTDWRQAPLGRPVVDPTDSVWSETGLTFSWIRAGSFRVPDNGEWMTHWPYNPLIRVVVARTWHVVPVSFGATLLTIVFLKQLVPCFAYYWLALLLAFAGVCVAAAASMAWHLGRLRGIVGEELVATLLKPREVVQGLALVPWALISSWCVVFLALDALASVRWHWLLSTPGFVVGQLVANGIGRAVLFLFLHGAIRHTVVVAVRTYLGQPARDMTVVKGATHLLGALALHLLRSSWPVWVFVLAIVIFATAAIHLGEAGIAVGCLAFPLIAMGALILLRIPVEYQPPAHLSPFHPYDTDFAHWRLFGGDAEP